MEVLSPCLSCGACCAKFRITYYWDEKVTEGYFHETSPMYRSLKSEKDSEGRPRCNALTGTIGTAVACGIYENRPSPCRDFKHSFEDGGPREERCDQARIGAGMLPLENPN
jgi:Fe-S-cluster containining protein